MTALDLMWWVGLVYFAGWVALPLALVPSVGPVAGAIAWALLAPWTALLGMAAAHRLLPHGGDGVFRPFTDRGSRDWALGTWAPAAYLAVFQPLFFLSVGFQHAVLRAFGAHVASGARVTTCTSLREPHRVRLGRDCFVGEHVQLACSVHPLPGVLMVAGITIGDDTLVSAHSVLGPGSRIGARVVVGFRVTLGAHVRVEDDTRIGAFSVIENSARIGRGVRIGKACHIPSGATVPDGTRLADHARWGAESDRTTDVRVTA